MQTSILYAHMLIACACKIRSDFEYNTFLERNLNWVSPVIL